MVERKVQYLKVDGVEIHLRDDAFSTTQAARQDMERETVKNARGGPVKIENPYFEKDEEVDDDLLFGSV